MTFFDGEEKSGLRRKKCRVITGRKTEVANFRFAKTNITRPSTDSAAENKPPVFLAGKGEKAV